MTNLKKKILIVGGGFGQLPAIRRAKEIGLEVINVDLDLNAPGMQLADFAYNIDVIDMEGVLEVAQRHAIDGILTMQSDLPVPTIGYVNDKLHLTGVSLAVANYCSNKIETRRRLEEKNCLQPRFYAVISRQEAAIAAENIGFPCIIKAPDSSGSRGVVKVNSIDQVAAAFEEALLFSRGHEVLVEEYVAGIEFGAQTFSEKGICKIVLLHNDTMSPAPYMIPIGHSFPFSGLTAKQQEEATNDITKAVECLGIQNGPANVDLILDEKTNRIKIIEVGARIGATCLPELVEYHTGINWVEATIRNAIGETADLSIKKLAPVAALIIEAPADGIFKRYQFEGEKSDLLEIEVTAKPGNMIRQLRKGTDRIGKVIAYGESAKSAEQFVAEVRGAIKIEVE